MCNFIWSIKQTHEAAARQLDFQFDLGEVVLGDKNPTDQICIILPTGFEMVRWSLIPKWSKEVPKVLMTQARSETLDEKPSFQGLMASNRCIIPVEGFYEWFAKQKYAITRLDEQPMFLAGLYDQWKDIHSAAIITTPPNPLVEKFQDRMPLILESSQTKIWLNEPWDQAKKLISPKNPLLTARATSGQGQLLSD